MSEAPIIGIVSPPGWYEPSVDEFRALCDEPVRLLRALRKDAPDADALVVAGAGVRMLDATPAIEDEFGCPVISSDTALYFSMMKIARLRPRPGALGRMGAFLD